MLDAGDLTRLVDRVAAHTPRIAVAYLFGSQSRGDAGERSDVDVAVWLEQAPESTLEGQMFDLEARLERELGRPVQVVVLDQAPPELVHFVLQEGRILLDRDTMLRVRREARARNEYFDLQPYLRAYRRLEVVAP